MTPASVLYDDGIAAAATGHACPDCAESRTGYMDSQSETELDYYRGRDAYLDAMLDALDKGYPIDVDEMWHMIDRIDTEHEAQEQRYAGVPA